MILLFIVTFKLGDAFLSIMTNPFYIDLGFTKTEIAEVTKLFGLIALAVGLFIGGLLIKWTGLLNALLISGVLQAASNFMFAYQAVSGNDLTVLTFTIAVENVTGGMGTAAFVAYLSSLTNTAFTATQYALLSAFTAFGRTSVVGAVGISGRSRRLVRLFHCLSRRSRAWVGFAAGADAVLSRPCRSPGRGLDNRSGGKN